MAGPSTAREHKQGPRGGSVLNATGYTTQDEFRTEAELCSGPGRVFQEIDFAHHLANQFARQSLLRLGQSFIGALFHVTLSDKTMFEIVFRIVAHFGSRCFRFRTIVSKKRNDFFLIY